jgi:hypothetical protein
LRFKIRPLHGLLIMLCLVAACGKSEKSGTPTSPAPHLATTATATQLNCSGIPKMPALPASARPKGKLQVKMVSNCQGHPNSCYSAKNGGVLYPVVQGNPKVHGFTPRSTVTVYAWNPDGSDYTYLGHEAYVGRDGTLRRSKDHSVKWGWACDVAPNQGVDAPGTYTIQFKDGKRSTPPYGNKGALKFKNIPAP